MYPSVLGGQGQDNWLIGEREVETGAVGPGGSDEYGKDKDAK